MNRSILKYCLVVGLLCAGFFSFGQKSEIDSIMNLIRASKEDTNKVNLLYELSKLQCFDLQTGAAIKSAKMAESLSKKMNYTLGMARSYHAIGNVYIQEGDYANALDYHLKAMKIKEALKDTIGLAASYNNLGKIYTSAGDHKKALEFYNRSLELKTILYNKALRANNEKEVMRTLLAVVGTSNSIATVLSDMGEHQKAISFYDGALPIYKKYDNQQGIAGNHENRGVCYYYMGNYKKALEEFQQTYQIREGILDKTHLVGTNLNLGKTYYHLGELSKAKKFLNESLELSKEVFMTDVTRDSYQGLYEVELKLGDHKKALQFYKRYIKYRDSISNESIMKRMTRLELNYDFEKKEKEAKLLQEKKDAIDKEKSEFQNVIIISMSVLFVIIAGFVMYAAVNYKQKQRINKEITLQKEIIEEKQTEIIASINYAKRIQNILLPAEKYIDKELNRLNQIK